MKKRKIIICILLLASLLTACVEPGVTTQPEQTNDAAHIVVTFPVIYGSVIDGLSDVQAAVNAITVPEIGVEVELLVVDASKTSVEYPNSITQGKQIDLMVLNNENIETYINQELVFPLDELLAAYGQGIYAIDGSYMSLFTGTVLKGHTYGVGIPSESAGTCGGLWTSKALLDEVSFHYEPEKIYSLEELDILFARIKEKYPDSYPLGQITNTYNFSTASFYLGVWCDGLNGSDPGALDLGGQQIVNQYELPEYTQLLQYMRKWYLDGYIYPDSAITSATGIGLYTSGIVKTVPLVGTPYFLPDEIMGGESVCLRLSPIRTMRKGSTGIFWTIPVTSKEPEAAMRFLNMMYTDARIVNLLSWGIQGRDYILEADGTFVPTNDPLFSNTLGFYGDQRLRYEIDGETRKAVRADFSKKSVTVHAEYDEFRFDSSELNQELLQIEQVKLRYIKLLESGCVDYDTVYPEFIQELYDAGLQRVMDEKQRQFDAWLAENT